MIYRSGNFIYRFFILFLCVLLLMFVMFTVMLRYDENVRGEGSSSKALDEGQKGSETSRDVPLDFSGLYRATLFAIDLCLIVLAEAAMIIVFVRFTIPAVLIATAGIIFITASSGQRVRSELVPAFVSRFVTNKYATLTHTDMMLLVALSGLIMAFLVSALLQQTPAVSAGQAATGQPRSAGGGAVGRESGQVEAKTDAQASQETASTVVSSSSFSPPPPSE